MSSLHHLSRRDLEALSAYLDGELRPAEAQRLEARLHREGDLRNALAELRSLREVLRTLPPARPPRSLTLAPEMVGGGARTRTYPALQLATALATVAFLLVSGTNAVLSRGFALDAGAPAEAPAMLQAAAPETQPTEITETEGAPMIAMAPSADAFASSVTPEVAERAVAPGIAYGEGLIETPEAAAEPAPAELAAEPYPTETPVAGEKVVAETQAPAIPLRALTWLQLGLGALAVGLAILTLRVRRQSR